jgi:hypothetical protein
MAIILSLRRKAVVSSFGAYIGAAAERQATAGTALTDASPQAAGPGIQHGLQQFHPDEPNLKPPSGSGSASPA